MFIYMPYVLSNMTLPQTLCCAIQGISKSDTVLAKLAKSMASKSLNQTLELKCRNSWQLGNRLQL